MLTKSEIRSMLFLLEDPDPYIKKEVLNRFYQLGENAVPLLDECQFELADGIAKEAVNDLLFELTFQGLYQDFTDLYLDGFQQFLDFEKAIINLNRFGNPTLRTSLIRGQLDIMASGLSSAILNSSDSYEQMQILLDFVFKTLNFESVPTNQLFLPENLYLNHVLTTRKGAPISLAMIILSFAHRLELPFSGSSIPLHFLLQYDTGSEIIFVDPYQRGRTLSKEECIYFIQINGMSPLPEFFKKANYSDILYRAMRVLQSNFERQNDRLRFEKIGLLLALHQQFYPC